MKFFLTQLRSIIRTMKYRTCGAAQPHAGHGDIRSCPGRHGLRIGYRDMFGGSVSATLPPSIAINERNTIASVSEPQAASDGNAREVGPATTGSIDNLVSREGHPAAVGTSKSAPRASLPPVSAPAMPASGQAVPKQAVPRAAVAAPAPIIAASPQRPGQSGSADDTAVEPRTFGCRRCRTSQCGHQCGSNRSRRCQWSCGSSYVGAQ